MKKVVVITGPTGIGKTSISVEVAKNLKAEIISADSAQVYQHLNIGTAKIKEEETQGVKHHLIDIVDPSSTYDVAQYQKDARAIINEIELPIIVGGTGLYIKATIDDYDFTGSPRDESFAEKYKSYTNEELYNLLKDNNYEESLKIHPNNRRRVLKALSGRKPKKKAKDVPVYNYLIFQLTLPRQKLYERINNRVLEMMEEGLLEEVKALKEQGLTFNIISYKQINDYLDGKLSLDEAIKELKKVTRRYAKRQETWFNNQMETIKIDASDKDLAIKEMTNRIREFYQEK